MYTSTYGFRALTRLEVISGMYEIYKSTTRYQGSFDSFQGTNVHLILNMLVDGRERLLSNFYRQQANQFDFWVTTGLKIIGSYGASYEGWINSFKDLCTSIDIISSDDSRISKETDPKKKLVPGEIMIYFDNLTVDPKKKDAIQKAWLQCKNVAEPTKGDESTFTKFILKYTNGDLREYMYFNLLESDYTPINLKYKLSYEDASVNYPEHQIKEHILENFERNNKINRALYPETYFCITEFKGISGILIKHKLKSEGDSDYKSGTKDITLGKKYSLTIKDITEDVS